MLNCFVHNTLLFLKLDAECEYGDIRLVNGDIEQEGRPEVCFDGIWGSICDYGWNLNDAYVTCLTLGFEGRSGIH